MTAELRRRLIVSVIVVGPLGLGACTPSYKRDEQTILLARQGQFGQARQLVEARATKDQKDRSFMLDRVKAVNMAIADGVPEAAEPVADRLYDFLRTQGVNADTGFGAFVVGEGNARVWKGEPFEQAMALSYIAVLDGMNGDWGNVRAVANNSLFQIRDLSKALANGAKAKVTNQGDAQLAERERAIAGLAAADQAANRDPKTSTDSIGELTTPAPSNFALGYVLKGIATRQLVGAFPGEAEEVAAQLNAVAPNLGELSEKIRSAQYNTVFVVDYGVGPEKYRTGPDMAISLYKAVTPSGQQPLLLSVDGKTEAFPVVTDVNAMAMDLRWNNLEDIRLAKSYIGTGLLVGGAAMVVASNNSTVQAVGLGLIALGALSKATAGADIRHNELLPQRTYVALANLTQPSGRVELMVEGQPSTQIVLVGLTPPLPGKVQLRYIRLADAGAGPWATSGQVLFGNDETGEPASDNFPYILGGADVRSPNDDVLSSYQRSGYLQGLTLNDLIDLYKQEGISIAGYSSGEIGTHILEGGGWLYTPRVGTAGFARLYGMARPPYVAKSPAVRSLAADAKAKRR